MTSKLKYILIFGLTLISCLENKKQTNSGIDNLKIEGWEIQEKRGKTDTLNVQNWIPEPELSLTFINQSDSTCLTPSLEFYPIDLENYIDKKLMNYLILRATLFPPTPTTYKTEKYFVIGWNFEDYNTLKCCECSELEKELRRRLQLNVKEDPKKLDFEKWK